MITADTALGKGSILIVDDVPDNLILLKEMLSEQGYKVRVAPSGRLAIRSVLTKHPDLILLDILMPDVDGYAVCQTLKANEQTCHIPIIFVSALSEAFDKVKAFSMGGSDYLTKPFQIQEVIARIEHQLNLNRLRQQIVDRNVKLEQEIRDRKAAELVLQRQAHIINQIHDSILTTDLKGFITNWNKGAERRFGFRNEEILGQNFSMLCVDKLDTFFQDQLIQPLIRKGEHAIELEMLSQNHDEFSAHLSLSVMKDDEQQSIGMIAYIRDISIRKQAEAEILKSLEKERELNEFKSSFITMVSHEYRTPLATILSSLDLLEYYGHCSTEQEKEEYCQQIRFAIQRMTGLLNDVLTIEKYEAGKFIFNPEPLDLKQFCEDLVTEIQGNIKTEHRISLAIEGQCSHAQMDKKLMHHIFSNLILNSVKYSPQGGTIKIKVICQDPIATFCIQDEGIGIPSEAIQNLFQSFFRASNVGNIAGSGLGLSIVKRLVESHGGSINVESQLGIGTTFVVALPLKPEFLLTCTTEQ